LVQLVGVIEFQLVSKPPGFVSVQPLAYLPVDTFQNKVVGQADL